MHSFRPFGLTFRLLPKPVYDAGRTLGPLCVEYSTNGNERITETLDIFTGTTIAFKVLMQILPRCVNLVWIININNLWIGCKI